MPRVRVREKHQITLPAGVIRAANISTNDILDISYKDGVIPLITQHVQKKRRSLMDYTGSTKGLYGNTTEERQQYIANERASWER